MDFNDNNFVFSVLVPIPNITESCEFEYLPGEYIHAKIGQIVKIPFGRRGLIWGIIKSKKNTPTIKNFQLKYISQIHDAPSLSKEYLKFFDWVCAWTMTNPGQLAKMILPNAKKLNINYYENTWSLNEKIKFQKNFKQIKSLFPNSRLTEKRKTIINYFLDQQKLISSSEILKKCKTSIKTLKSMEENKLIVESTIKKVKFENRSGSFSYNLKKLKLTPDQQKASQNLMQQVNKGYFHATLIDGVTGSGKTEVYFHAVASALKLKKQILILLPEISLTKVWTTRFEENFGVPPSEWHSEVSHSIKSKTWLETALGQNQVVVGARSALFLPFRDLGLIIIDEEHDQSFKQEEGILYNARDMALIRGKIYDCPVILSTATPSVETWNNVKLKNYSVVKLPNRIGSAIMPRVNIIDMRQNSQNSHEWISEILEEKISSKLKQKELILLFLNRRGYAPLKICRHCGHKIGCKNCQSWLVEHRRISSFVCHQCGSSEKIYNNCSKCGEKNCLTSCGPGVERLEEEVQKKFPDSKTLIISSDTLKNSKSFNQFLADIKNQKVNIIIGTQIISKGHNLNNLTLVGIIDADLSLSGGDLRASEKTFQLLQQVSGRAGREKKPGEVYIQTYDPENHAIQAIVDKKRDEFLDMEIQDRKNACMPPFGKLAAIILSSKNLKILNVSADKLFHVSPNFRGIVILGPAPAPLSFIRGKHRVRFLIKSNREINLQKIIKEWISKIKISQSVKLTIDIEPYSFL